MKLNRRRLELLLARIAGLESRVISLEMRKPWVIQPRQPRTYPQTQPSITGDPPHSYPVWTIKAGGAPQRWPASRVTNRADETPASTCDAGPQQATPAAIVHGVNCEKAKHDARRGGYLHNSDDDGPYNVDGLSYCGRCHRVLDKDVKK